MAQKQSPNSMNFELSTPQWIQTTAEEIMGQDYSKIIQKPYQPIIIDPLRIPEYIRLGYLIGCFTHRDSKKYWYISMNSSTPLPGLIIREDENGIQYQVPCCCRARPNYKIRARWEQLAEKKVRMNNDGWIVFVDSTFEERSINTNNYGTVDNLCAFIL